jgi:dihydroxyacetone kinase-like protein
MEKLCRRDIEGIFLEIRKVITRNKDMLISLDSAVGDGDLGLTMEKGFSKICDNMISIELAAGIGIFLKKSGFAMAGAAPSTMGTLVATGIMKAGDAVREKEFIELADFPGMLREAIEGIEQRGKAKRGEKTLLDSLYPALEALDTAVKEGRGFSEACLAAYDGAKKGVESTKSMKAVHGKAAVYGEKSLGKQDPGATAGMLIFDGICRYLGK